MLQNLSASHRISGRGLQVSHPRCWPPRRSSDANIEPYNLSVEFTVFICFVRSVAMREQMGVVSLQSFKEQWRKRISQSYILSFKSVTHLIPLFVKSILFCIVRRFGLPRLPLDVVCRFENPTCSAFDHPKQGAFHQTASYDRHLALPFLCHRSLCSRPLIQVVETWGVVLILQVLEFCSA